MSSSSRKVFTVGSSLRRTLLSSSGSPATRFNFRQFSNTFTVLGSSTSGPGPIPDNGTKEPFIPAYQQKEGESIETLKARLLYQSRKRGMLENGLLLSTFAAKFLSSMNEGELKEYDRLINVPSNDWDIYYWATGVKPIPKEFDTAILHKFIDHVRNTDKESRIRQPDLN